MRAYTVAFFLALFLLLCAFAPVLAETPAPTPTLAPPETPIPARIHEIPNPSPVPPTVVDRTSDPTAWPSFRFRLDANLLEIWFPNIMNADEAILCYQGSAWLIDCGDARMGSRGAELLKKLGITRIEKLFNSHPHHDHLNGFKATHQAAPVEELLVCFPADSTKHMIDALAYAEEQSVPVSWYKDGDVFSMGDGQVTIKFYVGSDPALDMNNASASALVQFGARRIFFASDIEKPGQASLLQAVSPEDLRAEILKYPHHGKSGLDAGFQEAVCPELTVITNLDVSWEGFKYLRYKQIPYAVTNTDRGYLHLATDGENWLAEYVQLP